MGARFNKQLQAAQALEGNWMGDPTTAIAGRVLLIEESINRLLARIDSLYAENDAQRKRISELEARAGLPHELLTEKETARLLKRSPRTLQRWREEMPPRIPFLQNEDEGIWYRWSDVEKVLQGWERKGR